jgi:hypothetical protein
MQSSQMAAHIGRATGAGVGLKELFEVIHKLPHRGPHPLQSPIHIPTPCRFFKNGLSAFVDVNVFHCDFLLGPAAMPVQRLKQRGMGSVLARVNRSLVSPASGMQALS